uniref:Uncharacterized protein n=1 Tax=Ditylenchus dipsaci TaxID=166011 RepID=A0A915DXN2_9BILA
MPSLGEILSSVAESSKIKVGSVHPGIVSSGVYRHVFLPHRLIIKYILPPFLRSSKLAAAHVLSLAFDDNVQSGLYYEDGCPVEHRRRSRGMTSSPYSSEELENLADNMRQVIHREL